MSEYAVADPATGSSMKPYSTISDEELASAVTSAAHAYASWSRDHTLGHRADVVKKVGELFSERREELAEIIVREMGKPLGQALGEVDFCVDIFGYYADNAELLMRDEPITLLAGDGEAFVRRNALGVLLGIMPWNYPYYQVARFAAPNLVIGNTVLLKPAPQCPESAAAIEQIMRDAGAHDGVYTTIRATNEQVAGVIGDPRIQGISLTGSERAGAAVAEIAGRNLKKVVLELGGSDPFILLSTDDLDATVEAAVAARLENSGQACNAAKRFIVVDDLYDASSTSSPSLSKHSPPATQAMSRWDRSPRTPPPTASKIRCAALSSTAEQSPPAGAARATSLRRWSSPMWQPTTPPIARSSSGRSRSCSACRTSPPPLHWPKTHRTAWVRMCSRPILSRRCASPIDWRPAWSS